MFSVHSENEPVHHKCEIICVNKRACSYFMKSYLCFAIKYEAHTHVCWYCTCMLLHVMIPWFASFPESCVQVQQGTGSSGLIWHPFSPYQWAACLLFERGTCYWRGSVSVKKTSIPTVLLILAPSVAQCPSWKSQFRLAKNHYSHTHFSESRYKFPWQLKFFVWTKGINQY